MSEQDAGLTTTIADFDRLSAQDRADWQALCLSTKPGHVFCAPQAIAAWRGLPGVPREVPVLFVRRGGALVGVYPLMLGRVWRGPGFGVRYDYAAADAALMRGGGRRPFPVRQLSGVQSLPATMLRPAYVIAEGEREAVIAAFAEAMTRLPGWTLGTLVVEAGTDLALWRQAFTQLGLPTRVNGINRALRRLEPAVSFGEILAGHAKKFRQNVRRAERAASEAGFSVSIEQGAEAYRRTRDLFAAIAAASWKTDGREEEDIHAPFEGAQRQFLDALCLPDDPATQPVVSVLSIAGNPVAVLASVMFGETFTMLFTFIDPAAAAYSPGVLLIGATIDWAHANGARVIDYNSNSPHTRRYANAALEAENLLVFNRTLAGRACAAIARLAMRGRGA